MDNPEWTVVKVTPQGNYTLVVEFSDGSIKKVDMSPVIEKDAVFAPLKNTPLFMTAKEQYGTVVWTDKIDIAPEYLYEHGVDIK
ncbi:DUF2442 domain-containing protein [Candidatus Saccharibacteria bacterium]|nr:DUF2442 domain-containing protein [Candidatus Saccharibacteria bacterium]